MSQTLRRSIQSPGRGAEVVVTAVTVAVAVTPASMEQKTGARSMTYKEAVAVGMDEQLAHLLVHRTIDEDDLVDAVVVVHVVRRELRSPPRLARVASRS
jgi:hypothetical protein